MHSRSFAVRSLVASVASLTATLTFASTALAQDPPQNGWFHHASGQPAAPAAPKSAEPTVVTPAPGQAAAAAPSSTPVPVTATCSLGDHYGVQEAEARTAADVLCHELAKTRATNTQHEIRFGTLGGRTLVTLASRNGNAYDERRTLISGMDEIHIASPRLVSALVDGKSMEDTRNVDNVLAAETRPAKVQTGAMGFDGGMFGTTGLGANSGGSAGVAMGLLYRASSWGIGSQGRAGGIGSGERKIGLASIDIGARYYLSTSEFSPFIGGGFALSYHKLNREKEADLSGSGFGAYGQIGAEFLRSHHTAFSLAVRVDAPFYSLRGSETYYNSATGSYTNGSGSAYVMPISFNVGILFH